MASLSFAEGSNEKCGQKSERAHSSVKEIANSTLPNEAKSLMKTECGVVEEGFFQRCWDPKCKGKALDVNDDGKSEFLLCCSQGGHGPTFHALVGKISEKWKQLAILTIFEVDEPFIILESKTKGYHDICQGGKVARFKESSLKKRITH